MCVTDEQIYFFGVIVILIFGWDFFSFVDYLKKKFRPSSNKFTTGDRDDLHTLFKKTVGEGLFHDLRRFLDQYPGQIENHTGSVRVSIDSSLDNEEKGTSSESTFIEEEGTTS